LLQILALFPDIDRLLQIVTTALNSTGIIEPKTPAENGCKTLINSLDELRVDNEWDIVNKAM